jgi:hypothetical protein
LNVYIKYPALDVLLIPTENGKPVFTKPMSIEFLVTVIIKSTGRECEDCKVSYDIDDTDGLGYKEINWDDFSKAFAGSNSSRDLECEAYQKHTLNIRAESPGLSGTASSDFYISCDPIITVNPIESRLMLGASDMMLFNVTLWNPLDENDFIVEMKPEDPSQDYVLSWLNFDCKGTPDPRCKTDPQNENNNDTVRLHTAAIGSESVYVHLDTAGRVGVYPIKFDCVDTRVKDGKGTIMIVSESLPEFALWQLIVLMLLSSVFFVFVIKE